MKTQNIYLILLFIVFSLGSFAQNKTGVNTKNPQGALHVDPKKNNAATGTPTGTQPDDDFIVDANGNVGIGVLAPSVKLHIKNATSPALTIVDGTQLANKILGSDANGVGTWIIPPVTKSSILSNFPTAVFVYPVPTGGTEPIYSLLSIPLSPGKWAVSVGMVFDNLGPNTFWQNAYLSSTFFGTPVATITQTNFQHLGPAGISTSYAGVLTGSVTFTPDNVTGTERKGFISGTAIIEVTGTLPSNNIYLMLQNQAVGSYRFNPLAPENYFYAIPVD